MNEIITRSTATRTLLENTPANRSITPQMYGICCCCMELPSLKSLWSEYLWMGQAEVYGNIIQECFNLTLVHQEKSKEQICEVCITQLRNAMQFKQRIVQSQARLQRLIDERKIIKIENIELNQTTEILKGESKSNEISKIVEDSTNITAVESPEQDIIIEQIQSENIFDNNFITIADLPLIKIEETFEDQSDAFADDRQSLQKRKTVKRKSSKEMKIILKKKRKPQVKTKTKKEERNKYYIKLRQNVCQILENSTIVPFKSRRGYFMCLYCDKQHLGFDELKTHCNEKHDNLSFKMILRSILRPSERIKADVSDITCKICKKNIENLDILVTHLASHGVKFNYDEKRPADSILAYDMSDGKYKCYICKIEFLFFKTLSFHMNTHSNDYVCDICGRCFLLPERLRAHITLHNEDKSANCHICGKICSTIPSLKSHIRYTHQKRSFLCSLCDETFTSYRLKRKHLEDIHKRAPLNLICKICSKKYDTPSGLNSHMRFEHLRIQKVAKHPCNVCEMTFKTATALKCHSDVHNGEKKFNCDVCQKKFSRTKYLVQHLKIHTNDKRWCCGACSHRFTQKISLKSHIRVHHGDMDSEQLIVYKKPDAK